LLQPPQLSGSVFVSTHTPPQRESGEAQPQVPRRQTVSPVQTLEQLPQ
jgi:hypothetical protein